MKKNRQEQISESLIMGILLALTGGFLDAYTYQIRGHVFANAQTGNMVLLAKNISECQWLEAFQYLIPIAAFAAGVYIAELIKHRMKENSRIHWRQIVVLIEILLLIIVAFLPQSANMGVNVTISFICAMQVETFRRVKGNAYATTMCTGNLRSATELICSYHITKDKELRRRSLNYYGIIAVFIAGALVGTLASSFMGEKAVLLCCILLMISFVIMFVRKDE